MMRLILATLIVSAPLSAQQPNNQRSRQAGGELPPVKLPDNVEVRKNLDYAGGGNPRQMLDLLLPKNRAGDGKLPVIVFIHGGAWRNGSKEGAVRHLLPFVESGEYIGATLNYRLTGESKWPAQIHDCKAAIRYLRGNAEQLGIDPENIAVWGSSAGGHLVSMLGTSGAVKELEGELGEFDSQSSRVTCVVNYFGPENFLTMVNQKSDVDRRKGSQYPEALLLGGPVQDVEQAARQASPVTWVSKDDPPFLTAHGTADPVVPFAQGEEIHAALQKAGVESHLIRVVGAGHGFAAPEVGQRVKEFLAKHLLGRNIEISDAPVEAGGQEKPNGTPKAVSEAKAVEGGGRIGFSGDAGAQVIVVRCKRGIGGATIVRLVDQWPDGTSVRLHLKGLESFKAKSGGLELEWSVSSDQEKRTRMTLRKGGEEKALEKTHPLYTEVGTADGVYSVTLPKKLFEGNPQEITLRWIDFYRG